MKPFPGARAKSAAIAMGFAWALVVPSPGSAESDSERAASQPGAFCTPSGCRPRPASAWTGAAFGTLVFAMGWRARRREGRQAVETITQRK